MPEQFRTLTIALLVIGLAAPALFGAQAWAASPSRGNLFGTVTEAGTGAPLEATITLYIGATAVDWTSSDSVTGEYSIDVEDGPYDVICEGDIYHSVEYAADVVVGSAPTQLDFALEVCDYLIWYPGEQADLAAPIGQALDALGHTPRLAYDLSAAPSVNGFEGVFIVLGMSPDNFVLTDSVPGLEAIRSCLFAGGNVYMEGGDTWFFDQPSSIHDLFHIVGLEDGNGDLSTVLGEGLANGLDFAYGEPNEYVDRIEPEDGSGAFALHTNSSPGYTCGVACEDEQWGCRTIGVSHCFAGLESGFSTPAELMQVYLNYFGSGPGPTPTVPYPTETPTRTPTETVTFTPTLTRSVTVTPLTATRTMTITRTPSVTATKTLTIVTETPTPSYTPTAGWTVTYTPTGGGTETYTPTATPAVIQIGLFMPAETFGTGDTCWLNLSIDNPGAAQEVDLYVLLDVYSNYWCYPSWAPLTAGLDWSPMTVTEGMSDVLELIPQFTMPQVSPAGPLYFYAAMFERDHLDLEHLVSTGAVATFYLE